MKTLLHIGVLVLLSFCARAQAANQPVTVVDFVKVKDGKLAETLFYYEQNWLKYREEALKQGYIIAYKLLKADASQQNAFDLMLMTEYASPEQQSKAEEHFQPIIRRLNPNGPKLLNHLKPAEFRENVHSYTFTNALPACK